MSQPPPDSAFTTDVAKFYESTLVPLIFRPYADDLARRAAALRPRAVLEVACGTGVVTRALALALPAACSIEATDLNEAMIAHGASVGTSRPVTWRPADAMALPYEDASFDVVVCGFGVMFFPDRVGAHREARRVLRPGGTLLFTAWRGLEHNDFARVVADAVGRLYPDDPPSFLARTPHGHGSPAELETDVRAAGFARCALNERNETSTAAGPEGPAVAYCQGTPLRNEITAREPGGLERATAAATAALAAHFGSGPIEGRISAVVVTAS